MAHFTYLDAVTHDGDVQKVITAIGVGTLLLVTGFLASAPIRNAAGRAKHIVPTRASITALFDFIFSAFIKYHDSIAGPTNRRYASISLTAFLFIFFSNLVGLVPGVPALTTTVWVNVGMALVVFFAFNYYGIRAHGLVNYIKHFAGPAWYLAWFIFPLEILSTCLRVLTLNLRLYWNITADHIVLGVFTDLTSYVVPVLFYALGTFICFMQAFVFTTLTIVYIFLAVQHSEEEHH